MRAFDDDFVRPDAVHQVVNALAALVEVSFDLQRGELVGNDAASASRGCFAPFPDADRRGFPGASFLRALRKRDKSRPSQP